MRDAIASIGLLPLLLLQETIRFLDVAVDKLRLRIPLQGKTLRYGIGGLALVYFMMAYNRVLIYKDEFTFVEAGLKESPDFHVFYQQKGTQLLLRDRYEECIPYFDRALELRPEQFERRYPLAMALTRLGRSAEAAHQLELFERARRQMIDRRRDEIAPAEESREPAGRK